MNKAGLLGSYGLNLLIEREVCFWQFLVLVIWGCSCGSLVGLSFGIGVVPIFFTQNLQCREGCWGKWLLSMGFRLDKFQRAEHMARGDEGARETLEAG
jgi:hypothetical protein